MDPAARQVVLITGAAGGLGTGMLAAFLRHGWHVAAGFHKTSLPAEHDVWPVHLDVTNREAVRAAVAQVHERWGRIDCLVNNAGITSDHALWQMTEETWDEVLAVNLTGACWCAQAVLPDMMQRRDGHIINVGSYSGRSGQKGQANYAAAKAGLLGLTTSLAKEAGPNNVRVNAILPGVLATPMTAKLTAVDLSRFAHANELGRLNEVDEVAEFTVFLARTRNISGQVFQLDSRIAPWT